MIFIEPCFCSWSLPWRERKASHVRRWKMAFFDHHHFWTLAFGILGNTVTFFVFVAPVTTFYRIYRNQSTEGFQLISSFFPLFSSALWLYYAYLEGHSILLITINSFGCVIEMVYIAIYMTYAPRNARNSKIKLFVLMKKGLFSLLILITRFIPNDDTRTTVFGWICTTISLTTFAAPLNIMARVVRTNSVEFMSFSLSFFLTLSAIMWFGYGFFQKDWCIMIPNIVGFVLGLSQMVLYGYYRNREVIIIMDEEPVTVEIPPPIDAGEARADEQQPQPLQLPEGAVEVGVSGDDPGSDQPS